MKFGPKHGSPVYIFENFIKDFGLLIIALLFVIVKKDIGLLLENTAVLVIVIVGPISRVIKYLFTTYAIDDEKLVVRSGWLNKKYIEIPLSSITTVDFTQNLVHQILNVYRLNVDNASNINSNETKISMTFSKEDALNVKELLTKVSVGVDGLNVVSAGREEKNETVKITRIEAKDLVLMGAIKSKLVFFLGLIGIVSSGLAIVGDFINISDEYAENTFFMVVEKVGFMGIVFVIALFFLILGIICGMIGAVIRYYDFHILDNGESIKINYGLITKKNFTIHKKKISGFYYEQSMFMRLFGVGTLKVLAIGYGSGGDDVSVEDPIVFPLIKKNNVKSAMADIIPEMEMDGEFVKPLKKHMYYFFYSPGLVVALIILVGSAILSMNVDILKSVWMLGLLIVFLTIISIIMQYFNSGAYINSNHLALSSGGFSKLTTFVKTNNVESVREFSSIWKRRNGATTITVGYIAPLANNTQKVKNLPLKMFDKIKSNLIY